MTKYTTAINLTDTANWEVRVYRKPYYMFLYRTEFTKLSLAEEFSAYIRSLC